MIKFSNKLPCAQTDSDLYPKSMKHGRYELHRFIYIFDNDCNEWLAFFSTEAEALAFIAARSDK